MLRALCAEHEFTVFSVDFDNPNPSRIRWVRIPAPRRPLALLFAIYHLLAPIYFRRHCRRHRVRFDLVQMVESNFSFGDISYVHFCHQHYLRRFWMMAKPRGVRGLFRWLDHQLHALGERWIYRRVCHFIVPSEGLSREIKQEYPYTTNRIDVIHNPIEIERLEQPADFDRETFRLGLGLRPCDYAFVFVALGHFERKGLPALFEALATIDNPGIKLVVVGGTGSTLSAYAELAARLGLTSRIMFTGPQIDVRPYLWSGDAFVLPSSYETFSLVTYEAAAAGLPIIVARTNGIEDLLREGENGILIGTEPATIAAGLRTFLALPVEQRRRMSARAKESVRNYSIDSFVNSWRAVYESQALG